ncbi:hypothetical protein ATANTOWER_017542, partial [Ataeniobius toweri]|nr:hypothetical protein [Ataeniobius toweri]
FMSVCQQRDISALSPPIPMITGVEEVGPLERGCFYAASGIIGKSAATVCLAVPEIRDFVRTQYTHFPALPPTVGGRHHYSNHSKDKLMPKWSVEGKECIRFFCFFSNKSLKSRAKLPL